MHLSINLGSLWAALISKNWSYGEESMLGDKINKADYYDWPWFVLLTFLHET